MLNELEEAKAYLENPDSSKPRIGVNLLTDHFKGKCKLDGLGDILTIVVCHYLYDFNDFTRFDEKMKSDAILIMRIWCGFEGDVTEEELRKAKEENQGWFTSYPQAIGWLRTYCETNFRKNTSNWLQYSEEWRDKLKKKLVYQAKRFCYENILAQAIARGPLKEYYLMISNVYDKALKEEIRNGEKKMPDARKQKTILKFLAAYKILQRYHPGQKYVLLPTNRLLNWAGLANKNENVWCIDLRWNDKPLFLKETGRDYIKFCVEPSFVKSMDICLLEELPKVVPNDHRIYRDGGYGKSAGLINI